MKKVTRKRIGGFKTYAERKANRAVLKANKPTIRSEDEKKKWVQLKKYERILETGLIPQGDADIPLVTRTVPFITSKGKKVNTDKTPDKWGVRCGQHISEGSDKVDEWENYKQKLADLRRELNNKNVRKK